uniref:Uncharacterized protein n=1 Tax=Myoviridae sp. ct3wi9 TaxID=2826610 RepID=A0A8S5MWV8_9CAUD|nr:MAG TPA: hypothetical protein [Myoviridae sp. ct3wi9]DAQ08149.1 MAG TPA: hypothetical protein [Caudoviricetes sp.]DAW54309.1 MAG TPA: hypothetical protein [Caudoviricetes sp.]
MTTISKIIDIYHLLKIVYLMTPLVPSSACKINLSSVW